MGMKAMHRLFVVALLLALPVVATPVGAANRFEVYPFGLADEAAMEQMAKQIVGADGNVVLDAKNRRLLVFAPDDAHKKLVEFIKKADVAPVNVLIDVDFADASMGHRSEASVSGGGVIVDDGRGPKATWNVRPRLVNRTTENSSNTRQQLMVASGRSASLRIGESIPYTDWFMQYGLDHGLIAQRTQWQDTGSFLIVEPVVLGDGTTIRVRLTPEIRASVNGQPQVTRFAAASTDVVVGDGQALSIGGLAQDNEFYSRFLVGRSKSGSTGKLSITLTPHIQRPQTIPADAKPSP